MLCSSAVNTDSLENVSVTAAKSIRARKRSVVSIDWFSQTGFIFSEMVVMRLRLLDRVVAIAPR